MIIDDRKKNYTSSVLGRNRYSAGADAEQVAIEHLTTFWSGAITEGRTVPQGHLIDLDEVDYTEDMIDSENKTDPEVQTGLMFSRNEAEFGEAPCTSCSVTFCTGVVGLCPLTQGVPLRSLAEYLDGQEVEEELN